MKCNSCSKFVCHDIGEGCFEAMCLQHGWCVSSEDLASMEKMVELCPVVATKGLPTHIFRYWLAKFNSHDWEFQVTATQLPWSEFVKRYRLDKVKVLFHAEEKFVLKPQPKIPKIKKRKRKQLFKKEMTDGKTH